MPEVKVDTVAFTRRLARVLAEDARAWAEPEIRRHSKTLADALQVLSKTEGVARSRVYLDHYWAVYVHDGRGAPFGPTKARVLVWFRNPKNDPRLKNGYPVRAGIRRLSKDEIIFWQGENRQARKLGLPLPMIVTPMVKNRTQPTLFFENEAGMFGFASVAHRKAGKIVSAFVLDSIGADLNIKDELVVRLDL